MLIFFALHPAVLHNAGHQPATSSGICLHHIFLEAFSEFTHSVKNLQSKRHIQGFPFFLP